VNRLLAVLTLCVVATGVVSRTQHTETSSRRYPSGRDAVPHNALAIASCDEEARVFHWRLTMPPDSNMWDSEGVSGAGVF